MVRGLHLLFSIMSRSILCAFDFSPSSRRAFTTALTLARVERATLTAVHVIAPMLPLVSEEYVAPVTWDRLYRDARKSSEQRLARLARHARAKGVAVTTMLLEGDPAGEIARFARAKHADLVVVGTHARAGLSKLLLGSVAEQIVATAPCPVVTVRSPRAAR